jgi:hypothetical protein
MQQDISIAELNCRIAESGSNEAGREKISKQRRWALDAEGGRMATIVAIASLDWFQAQREWEILADVWSMLLVNRTTH